MKRKAKGGRKVRHDCDIEGCDACFYRGFAVAVASVAREHNSPSMAVDIMNCNGVTFMHLKNAGVEEFDLKPLRSEWMQSVERKAVPRGGR